MRKIMLLVLFLLSMVVGFGYNNEYCEGWNDGYPEGYCYNSGYSCMAPMTPMCPMPNYGQDGYNDGYNRGFLRGLRDYRGSH